MSHGVLTKRTRSKSSFDTTYSIKMGIDVTNLNYPTSLRNKVDIYSFNKDLMFILKARIFMLRNITMEKVRYSFNNTIIEK